MAQEIPGSAYTLSCKYVAQQLLKSHGTLADECRHYFTYGFNTYPRLT